MRLDLALATVRFDAFPREDFVAMRALRPVVTRFLCSTFDRFFNLAMIGPSQCCLLRYFGRLSAGIDADQIQGQPKIVGLDPDEVH